ncbi:hypothetical protein CAOG_06653 [Capsaspora owczarzaki ATCC 30864]|uniref:Uncharacterized protein n=1 Tax=Capsaspora owczarzaki (strain ATCC 30864) TaxID=595528 RepID=A0A0D2UMP5_CAPO3|nr:hypothetical protein CAOG_06653 [Capsaspora owczarzaki ATCC 30864]KJE96311.1 hypothetical protein CAOG_006653 [Capsaspora owczarzaki ATCC 30864]|eukprot:XP_004344274.1 hypothetical protein CAOG_06653 [Capsaspora owczarzaki ATCC 30864]
MASRLAPPTRAVSSSSAKVVVFNDPTAAPSASAKLALASTSGSASSAASLKGRIGANRAGAAVPVVAAGARVTKSGDGAAARAAAAAAARSKADDDIRRARIKEKAAFAAARAEVLDLGMKGQLGNKDVRQKLRLDKHGRPLPKQKLPFKMFMGVQAAQKKKAIKEREAKEQLLGRTRPTTPKKKK